MNISFLKECLSYCAETGEFFWLTRPIEHFSTDRARNAWNGRYAGKKAGHVASNGYIVISINNKCYKAHRLAVAISTGRFPSLLIDHKNLDPSDNRFANLREATKAQNAANKSNIRASSGVKGVSWKENASSWQVRVSGKYVGQFKSLDEAKDMYFKAAKEKFGEFARSA